MNGTKRWWQSTGVIGGIVGAIAKALIGWGVLTADQGQIINEALPTLLVAGIGLAGDALAIYGRVSAKKTITKGA